VKVLQINFSDYFQGGGGAIAMHRLHQGLKQQNVESSILCGRKTLNSHDSIVVPQSSKLDTQIRRWTGRLGLNDIHITSTFGLRNLASFQDADVLNFHILHSGFFNYLAIPQLTTSRPAIFTLHDMWAFTGHCAYSYDCCRWQTGCGQCPDLDSPPSVQRDNTHLEWKLKKWVYNHSDLAIVAPSQWLTEQARKSMLSHLPIYHIPYGLDTEIFQPHDSELCRRLLGIPLKKKVLMYSAVNASDRRKGMDLLYESLQNLPTALKSEIVLLVMGSRTRSFEETNDFQIFHLGYIDCEQIKAIAYSTADLFVFPTRADNLPLVLQESLACGTPIVSFKVGGVPDLVRPGVTGYLAAPEDASDLAQGIVELLEDDHLRQSLSNQCRATAVEEYNLRLQAERYINVYKHLLQLK
jgi:glycosyltransferase involved in cell wall biosynthesis